MIRLDLIVPTAANDGTTFPDSKFTRFERLLVDLCRGFTRHGNVEGAWKSPDGRMVRDVSRLYTVSVPSDLADRVTNTLSETIRSAFDQEAVLVEQVPTRATSF